MSGLAVNIAKQLPGFSLSVGWEVRGGFTVLFGYSGAGKSLTLAAIAGTMRPDIGRITLAGRTLFDSHAGVWVPPQARHLGYVPQSGQLFPHMTVRGNVAFALHGVRRDERAERVAQVLDRLGIAEFAERLPHQLSGGQRQRAALGRAIVARPCALLLDEPFSALDLPVRIEMRELIREMQRDLRIPVVMVTHDLHEACSLADTMVAYSKTGTVQTGTPRQLIADPATPELRRLLRAIELPESAFARPEEGAGRVVPLKPRGHVA